MNEWTDLSLLEDYLEMERGNLAAFSVNGQGKRPRRGLELQMADTQERIAVLERMTAQLRERGWTCFR